MDGDIDVRPGVTVQELGFPSDVEGADHTSREREALLRSRSGPAATQVPGRLSRSAYRVRYRVWGNSAKFKSPSRNRLPPRKVLKRHVHAAHRLPSITALFYTCMLLWYLKALAGSRAAMELPMGSGQTLMMEARGGIEEDGQRQHPLRDLRENIAASGGGIRFRSHGGRPSVEKGKRPSTAPITLHQCFGRRYRELWNLQILTLARFQDPLQWEELEAVLVPSLYVVGGRSAEQFK